MKKIYHLLRKLGFRSTYSGYTYLAYAIFLTLENGSYLRQVTQNLYVDIGKKYNVSNHCVESALRTLITSYWNEHNDRVLRKLFGYRLNDKPTSRELISMLADYLREHS